MADPTPTPSATPGPWSHSRVTTVKMNAVEISISTKMESTHVPPDAPAEGPVMGMDIATRLLEAVGPVLQLILARLASAQEDLDALRNAAEDPAAAPDPQ